MKPQSSGEVLLSPEASISQAKDSQGLDSNTQRELLSALARLDTWIEVEGFQGWDPHDALNSPLLRWAGRQRFMGIVAVQLLRRSPLNLRPVLGIRKGYNPKAMGLFLATYARKFIATHREEHLERVRFFFNWLIENASPGYSGPCWGYNFDWPNRGFLAPAGTPTIVNTAFIGLSFLSAEPVLSTAQVPPVAVQTDSRMDRTGSQSVSTVARRACEFILRDLHTMRESGEGACFSYTPIDHRFIHNANLLGAWLLAAVYARTRESRLAEAAVAAARFTARRQRSDGSWTYGVAKRDGWVDNFHTGYVLVALKHIAACLNMNEFDSAVQAGYEFWKTRMFQSGVIPKYYPDSLHPIDIHSVAQAILTFLEFSETDPGAYRHAEQVALWSIHNMQDEGGYFHYQIRRTFRIKIPYMRWSQAWMQQALTALCGRGWLTRSKEQSNANLG